MKHKLIFLDIDGVLRRFDGRRPAFAPECCASLDRIVRETGAHLVISSEWRNAINSGHMTTDGFALLLASHGVTARVIGFTDVRGSDRGRQISCWIASHAEVGRWIAIDDEEIELPEGGQLIRTIGVLGLTGDDADRAIRALGRYKKKGGRHG